MWWTLELAYHRPDVSVDVVEDMVGDLDTELHGVCSIDPLLDVLNFRVSLEADSMAAALERARKRLASIARRTGTDVGDLVRASVGEERWVERLEERDDLISASDIAKLKNVSRQRAHQLTQKPGFPEPVGAPASGPVWHRASVLHYLADARNSKPGRRGANTA